MRVEIIKLPTNVCGRAKCRRTSHTIWLDCSEGSLKKHAIFMYLAGSTMKIIEKTWKVCGRLREREK
jgi:hypothetical protein